EERSDALEARAHAHVLAAPEGEEPGNRLGVRHGGLARSGRRIREERENAAERLLEVAPLDDHVELSVCQQELRTLESFGQRLTDRLGDDPRAGEADQGGGPGGGEVSQERGAPRG